MKHYYQTNTIAIIGNHLPRQCGIATFTTDLCDALSNEHPEARCIVAAVTDVEDGYVYPERVRYEIHHHDIESYKGAADFLNVSGADVVSLQHEYGIFGGEDGAHILSLIEQLRIPVVTTLHTVLDRPTVGQFRVMKGLALLSKSLIVMSRRAEDILRDVYDIPNWQIKFIPHGVPDLTFTEPDNFKKAVGLNGIKVILTSGLLSPNKGIEHVIWAMPQIVRHHPDSLYVIMGTTHPHVRRSKSEEYRESLAELTHKLGVQDHVLFHDSFVDASEFEAYMKAADIFITPYNSQGQIVSGVLSYALGAGKAIISTPYFYAEEMLRNGRGVLVRFGDSRAIAKLAVELLRRGPRWNMLRHAAYKAGRRMIWSRVADEYMSCFESALEHSLIPVE